jgi:arginine exporter protein ArgO
MRYGGAAFLIWYGWRNAVSAWRGGASMDMSGAAEQSLPKIIATLAALTWLNPHVYLDTVVMIGLPLGLGRRPRVSCFSFLWGMVHGFWRRFSAGRARGKFWTL